MPPFPASPKPFVDRHDVAAAAHPALHSLLSATKVDVYDKYGVAADGTDRTAQFVAALAGEPAGVVFSLRPGTLVLDDVTVGGTAIGQGRLLGLEGVPGETFIQAANPGRKALTVTSDSRRPGTLLTFSGVSLNLDQDRPYDVPVVRIEQTRNWVIERNRDIANNHTGLFWQFDGSYEGTWRDSYCYGDKWAVPFEWLDSMLQPNSTSGKPPQADTLKLDRWTNMGCLGGIFRDAGNEAHGIRLQLAKVVSQATADVRVESTLTTPAAIGDTTLTISTTDIITGLPILATRDDTALPTDSARSGIKANDPIFVDWGGKFELNKVVSYNAGTGVITLAKPLTQTHDSTSRTIPVRVVGMIGFVFGSNYHTVTADTCHLETGGTAFDLGNVSGFESVGTYCSCHEHIRVSGGATRLYLRRHAQWGSAFANQGFVRASHYIAAGAGDDYLVHESPPFVPTGAVAYTNFVTPGSAVAFTTKNMRDIRTSNGLFSEDRNANSAPANTRAFRYWFQGNTATAKLVGYWNGLLEALGGIRTFAKHGASARISDADFVDTINEGGIAVAHDTNSDNVFVAVKLEDGTWRHTQRMKWRGAYSAAAYYDLGDVVTSGGSTWVALADFLHGTTPAAGASWANVASATLTRTAVKTAAYTAAAGELVPVDTTSGAVPVTLPTAPADGTQVLVKHIIQGGTNAVTVSCGGSDVFNKTGGATSATLSLLGQAIWLQYQASGAIWTVLADDLPLSQLDLRYALKAGDILTGELVAPDFKATGKTGATATPVTLAGGTTTGAPTSGAHVVGELVLDAAGLAWYCTVAGTPGTWVQVNGGSVPMIATKATNFLVPVSDTTVHADAELTIAVLPGTYELHGGIVYDGPTTADLKMGLTVPAGTTGWWNFDGLANTAANALGSRVAQRNAIASSQQVGAAGVGTVVVARPQGRFVVTTAGNVVANFGQGSSDAGQVTVFGVAPDSSYLRLVRLA